MELMYDLLFCDDLQAYAAFIQDRDSYPWNILLPGKDKSEDHGKDHGQDHEKDNPAGLQGIIDDRNAGTRVKLLAYRKLSAAGHRPVIRELLGVIVEIGLDEGLDVLASYKDGTARYINQSGKMIIWETPDSRSAELTDQLFRNSEIILQKIGPWDKPRFQPPVKGFARISFLVSDGLYFGEAPMNTLFNVRLAGPALHSALALVTFLTERPFSGVKC